MTPQWWHPLRSPKLRPSLGQHLLAVLLSLVLTWGAGVAFWSASGVVMAMSAEIAGVLAVLGMLLVFAPLFSWAGHLPGALLLHAALKAGRGGWLVATLAGAVVGLVLTGGMDSAAPMVFAPVLAVVQLGVLRVLCQRTKAESPAQDAAS